METNFFLSNYVLQALCLYGQYGPWTQLIKRYFILLMCLQIWREYHRDKDCISAIIPVSENENFLRKICYLIIITVFLILTMYLKSRFLNYNIVPNCKDSNYGISAFQVWPIIWSFCLWFFCIYNWDGWCLSNSLPFLSVYWHNNPHRIFKEHRQNLYIFFFSFIEHCVWQDGRAISQVSTGKWMSIVFRHHF